MPRADQELVTPTGAAILAVAARFERPAMTLKSIGYGIGARDVPGNALAVWIGEEAQSETGVTVIETNLDDMAPNLLAALCEDLMAAGRARRDGHAGAHEEGPLRPPADGHVAARAGRAPDRPPAAPQHDAWGAHDQRAAGPGGQADASRSRRRSARRASR